MNKSVAVFSVILLALAAAAPACKGGGGEASESGSVYVMSNATSGNTILAFTQDASGVLSGAGSFVTQGNGTGSSPNPLGSQGSLCLTKDGKWVIAVNAGSNEISVMQVTDDGLVFASKTSSLGQSPVSLAANGNVIFVLNSKSIPPNITPFKMDNKGNLTAQSSGIRLLPPGEYTQVGFSPNGKWLVVAGNSIKLILAYSVNGSTPSNDPFFVPSNGGGPVAFAFDKNGNLLVAESAANAVSSYSFASDGLKTISNSVTTGQRTPSWIAVSGNFAYTVNLSSHSISSFSISTGVSGELTLLQEVAATASGPTDIAASSDGKYLYVLDPASRTVDVFRVGADGSLTPDGTVLGLFGISAQGIAAS